MPLHRQHIEGDVRVPKVILFLITAMPECPNSCVCCGWNLWLVSARGWCLISRVRLPAPLGNTAAEEAGGRCGKLGRSAMAAGGGHGEAVEQYRSEVERLTHELSEANREKIRAAECGLVVLEENQTLKQQYADLEAEQQTLRQELEQLQEVKTPAPTCTTKSFVHWSP